jgi:tetratricopeptide (TPR) repeat protein
VFLRVFASWWSILFAASLLYSSHLQRGEKEQAVRELKAAVALNPQSAVAHLRLAEAYLAQGAHEMMAEAKAELQQALALDPELVWARFHLAKIHFDLGRLEKAREELERGLATRPNLAHLLTLLGEVNRKLGNAARSIELQKKALAADPSMTPAHYYMGLAFLDLAQEDEARGELESAVRSSYVIPEMYIALGSLLARRGEFAAAAEQFRKAVALDPSRPEGHVRMAEIYRLQKAYDRALQELDLAVAGGKRFLTSPYFQQVKADMLFERARVYQDQGAVEKAIEAFGRVLEVDPDHAAARRQLELLKAR